MAEVLGIAAAAIGLANTGLSVARFLKSYADSVRTVDKQIAPVASQVQITSTTLENIGSLFKDDKLQGICTDKVLEDTKDALNGCRDAFNALQNLISSLMKLDESGNAHISTATMFTFYFREKELDSLQARLERLKTSLVLIFEVLNLRLLMKAAKDSTVIEDQRREISRLLADEQEARRRESLMDGRLQDLLQQSSEAKGVATKGSSSNATVTTPPNAQDAKDVLSDPQHSNHSRAVELSAGLHGSDQTVRKDDASGSARADHPPSLTARDQELFDALRLSAGSANDLSVHVKLSMSLWQQMQEGKHCGLVPSISATKRFFSTIDILAQKLEIYDQHFEWTRSIVEGDPKAKLQIRLAAKPRHGLVSQEDWVTHESNPEATEDRQINRGDEVPQLRQDQHEDRNGTKTAFDVDELLRRWTTLEG